MKIYVESIFPTGIMVVDEFISTTQRNDIVNYIKSKELHQYDITVPKNAYSNWDGGTDFIKEITNNVSSCADLHGKTTYVLNEYAKALGLSQLKLSNSWTHIQQKGSYVIEHTHPNSKVSGVLYISVDDDSNNLVFKNPNPYIRFEAPVVDNEFNYGISTIPVTNGRFVLFPSWLEHGSNHQINNTDERIMISFNSLLDTETNHG